MTKLLHAGVYRLWKDRMFRRMLLLNAVLAAYHGFESRRDHFSFVWAMMGILALAVVVTMSIGGEYENGGFRNKLIMGHSRGTLFFSELFLAMGAGILFLVEYALIFLCFNLYVLWDLPAQYSVQVFLGFLSITLSMCAVFVFLGTLKRSRMAIAILCVLVMVGMLLCGQALWTALSYEETELLHDTETVTVTLEDGTQYTMIRLVPGSGRLVPNPNYVAQPLRTVYEGAFYLMPFGALLTYDGILNDHNALGWFAHDDGGFDTTGFQLPEQYQRVLDLTPWGCLALTALAAAAGWLVFRKKEFN